MTQPDEKKRSSDSSKYTDKKAAVKKQVKNKNSAKKRKQLQKKVESKKRSQPFTVFLTTLLVIFITILFAAGGTLIGGYVAIINSIPDLGIVGIKPGSYTSYIYDKNDKEISKLYGNENREYVTIDLIPEYMQKAVVAIEDQRFYEHDGVDLKGFLRAAYSTLTNQQLQGGSTITQQLIKNNITKVPRNNFKTKIKEQYLALKYEKVLTEQYNGSKAEAKKYIMELYLNTIGLGHGYNGVKVAAKGYFGKEPADLTLAECASLAGITNNPTLYSPRLHPENNIKRQKIILQYMLEQKLITQQEYDTAIKEDVIKKVKTVELSDANDSEGVIHSYYEDALIDQISQDLQTKYNMSPKQASNIIYDGGLKIYSNLDPEIQEIVDTEFKNDDNFPYVYYRLDVGYTVSVENKDTGEQTHSDYQELVTSQSSADSWVEKKKAEVKSKLAANEQIVAEKVTYSPQPQAAMAIIDYHTGQIRAIGGGRGEKTVNRGFNRATDATRQPGSVFKPLAAYAPAFDLGKINAATIIVDEPYKTSDGYAPKNWWGSTYRGAVTSRTGLKDSMNVVAVKIMVGTGIDVCYNYLLNFGFTTLENDNHAATALGGLSKGVTQVEVAAAYGTLANNGEYLKPMFYEKVLDHDGNVLLQNNKEPIQVVKSSTGFILTNLMKSVITEGTGTSARFKNSSMPVSGKTGTTTDSKDLTFVGYTPYYVGSIWLGYDRYNDEVKDMNGVDQMAHLRIWSSIMEQIHKDLKVKEFPVPNTVVKATVCKYSGKKATNYCASVTDYFEKGTPATDEWCSGNHRNCSAFGGGDMYSGYSDGSDKKSTRRNSSRSDTSNDDDDSDDNSGSSRSYNNDANDSSSSDNNSSLNSNDSSSDVGNDSSANSSGSDSNSENEGGGSGDSNASNEGADSDIIGGEE